MKSEELVNNLIIKGYHQYMIDSTEIMSKLQEKNIDVWTNGQRIIFFKEYKISKDLLGWNTNDQSVISEALEFIPNKLMNNLYFFLVINFKIDETEIKLTINKIEKNDLIAKKVVLKNITDLTRLPFLNDITVESVIFNFDEKFRSKFYDFEKSNTSRSHINLDLLLENYFNSDTNDFNNIEISKLLYMGDFDEYR
ncbi:ABC-three component system middle component 1 [Enterococcus casseliflavus]|uniref:ABC-three component system middle component 1 n=1 Tax=Enterococcus casseliflavus TaxID=37734 RepID=UPI0022E3A49F|nr:ABC-three component system middle component 1 [Enterococcus casseliflavus]